MPSLARGDLSVLRGNVMNIVLLGAFALAGLLLVALVGLLALGTLFGGCSDKGRAVLEEFPHYGDRRIEPYSGEVSCNVRYPIDASREEVLGYYDEQLRENGWEVVGFWAADPPKGIEFHGENPSNVSQRCSQDLSLGPVGTVGEPTRCVFGRNGRQRRPDRLDKRPPGASPSLAQEALDLRERFLDGIEVR